MPTAAYGSTPKKVTSIGVITAAALMPAKPVPSPAPMPAKRHTNTVITYCISITCRTVYHIRIFFSRNKKGRFRVLFFVFYFSGWLMMSSSSLT